MEKIFHVFKHKDINYLYLTNYKQLFNISDDEFNLLNTVNYDENLLASFCEIVNPIDQIAPLKKDQTRYGLFLNVANTCNARCIYCFANQGDYGKAKGIMENETAYSSIDYYMSLVPDDCDAFIIYFGGEPLLAYNVIVDTCEYTKKKYSGKKNFSFHIVTNGVLLTKEKIDYFAENNFGVAISIDGGREIQNLQRPLVNGKDSFQEVTKNLDYLISKIHNVHARGTYCNYNYNLANIYRDLISLGFKEVNVPPDILDIKNLEEMNKLLGQLDILYDYIVDYIKINDNFPFGLFITHIRSIFIPKLDADYGCGLGKTTISVDINGDIFPCHRFSSTIEMKLGNVKDNNDKIINSLESVTYKCKKCWNQFSCSHGCTYNDYIITGQKNKKNEYWCLYSQKMTELSLTLISQMTSSQIRKILSLPPVFQVI